LAHRRALIRGPDPVDAAVGARIRIIRKDKGLSQGALGHAVGLSFQQVQKYESGLNRVSASILVEIAKVLEVSPSELLGDHQQAANPPIAWSSHTADVVSLVKAYKRIRSRRSRLAAATLVAILADRPMADLMGDGADSAAPG
jgi:transcriptional regulator with XRE-family HTH domain